MSGPKTSELEIQQRIRERLNELRHRVDRSVTRTRRDVDGRVAEVRRLLGGGDGAGERSAELLVELEHAAERARQRLRAECSFAPASRMDRSEERAEQAVSQAAEILSAFESEAERIFAAVEALASRRAEQARTADFAARLRAVAAEQVADADAGDSAESVGETGSNYSSEQGFSAWNAAVGAPEATGTRGSARDATGKDAGAVAGPDALDVPAVSDVQEVARRALALISDPCTQEADRAVLLRHGANLSEGTAGALGLLLAPMERNACTMGDMLASIETLRDALTAEGVSADNAATGRFATLEEAATEVARLESLRRQAAENAYLRACIDEVMVRHGYDICRSVTMGRDLTGTHSLYGTEGERTGLHVFASDQGDLMIQVAGLPRGIGAVADGSPVVYEPVGEGVRASELVEAQNEFCSVYDEIAEELAEFGIANRVRYRAKPDSAFSREMVAVAEGESAKTGGDAESVDGSADSEGEATASSLHRDDRRAARHRRSSAPSAREMR